MNTALAGGLPLQTVRGLVTVREAGHVTALTCTIALALSFLANGVATGGFLATAADAVSFSGLTSLAWKALQARSFLLAALIAGAAAGRLSSWKARRSMEDRFADRWRTVLDDLRSASL